MLYKLDGQWQMAKVYIICFLMVLLPLEWFWQPDPLLSGVQSPGSRAPSFLGSWVLMVSV